MQHVRSQTHKKLATESFMDNCVAQLLESISLEEHLSPEAEEMIIAFGSNLMIDLAEGACAIARTSKQQVVTEENVKFAFSKYEEEESKEPEPTKEHLERMKILQKFRESQE